MTLDTAYANADFIPDAASYPDRWADTAEEFRTVEHAIGRARLNQPYGAGARQALDLFLPAGRPVGLVVFVHGGYWRRFGRRDWSHLAAGPTGAGWAVAVPSYTLAPEARIRAITQEIAQAIAAACGLVPDGPVVLTGHSAGGHLVARMAMADGPLPAEIALRVARVVPISPLGDLRPLRQTAMNDDLRLDAAEAEAESPVLGAPRAGLPVSIWVGADERPVFLEQARTLAAAWRCDLTVSAGRHHFDVIDGLTDPASPMVRDLTGH